MSETDRVTIRSFRVCFELERRLHKIDRWRIPLPYGLPLRGIAYYAALLVLLGLLSRLPAIGTVLGSLHPALRYGVLPVGAAAWLTRVRIDGRTAHATAHSWLRVRTEPRRVSAFRPIANDVRQELGTITLAPDEYGSRPRPGVVSGAAQVTVRYPAALRERGRTLEVTGTGTATVQRGMRISLNAGQRIVLR